MMNATAINPATFGLSAEPQPVADDYEVVRRILAVITEHWRRHPSIDEIAQAVGSTPTEVHHLFRRWCGLTPMAFMQAITLDHAKSLLEGSASVLDTALEVGLSGPGRLHDLFVTHEAMTPGEVKREDVRALIETAW